MQSTRHLWLIRAVKDNNVTSSWTAIEANHSQFPNAGISHESPEFIRLPKAGKQLYNCPRKADRDKSPAMQSVWFSWGPPYARAMAGQGRGGFLHYRKDYSGH